MGCGRAILVVEDNFLTAESYRFALGEAGFAGVHLAADFAAAPALAQRLSPAAAVIDLHLGGSVDNGLELAARLMRLGVAHVVIVTGYAVNETELGRLPRQPAAVLQKPARLDELVAVLRRCLEADEG